MSTPMDFTISEDTLSWLSSIPHQPSSQASRRGPSRSSTYHESDSKFALRVQHNRRFSLATPPVPPPRPVIQEECAVAEEGQDKKVNSLMDLPNEILDTIIGYAISPSSPAAADSVINVLRRETEEACTAADIESGAVVSKWKTTGYPSALFLVNHTLSAIAFRRVWADSAVNISLTSADALCFLKYAISERQRVAMRRVRFPKIMLSWTDPVGQDVWLRESAREGKVTPGFVQDEEQKRLELEQEVAVVEEQQQQREKPVRPTMSRMQSLVGLLQTRSSPALGLVAS